MRVLAQLVSAATFVVFVGGTAHAQVDDDPWLGPDKAMHFGLSAGLAGGGYGLAALIWEDHGPRLLGGAALALSLGVAKELVDLTGAGDASWKDLAWDVIGTCTGLLIALLLDVAIRAAARARAPPHALTPIGRVAF